MPRSPGSGSGPCCTRSRPPISALECGRLVDGLAAGLRGLGVATRRPDRPVSAERSAVRDRLAGGVAAWGDHGSRQPDAARAGARPPSRRRGRDGADRARRPARRRRRRGAAGHDASRSSSARARSTSATSGRHCRAAPRLALGAGARPAGAGARGAERRAPGSGALSAGDAAVLTYTSGTTGPPKGAINTHGNIAFASEVYRVPLESSIQT